MTVRFAGGQVPSRERGVSIAAGALALAADLALPEAARGIVVFAHGSGSSRASPRNRHVAAILGGEGFATLLLDLLSAAEDRDRAARFDIGLLAERLAIAVAWARAETDVRDLPLGLFGASTGAAAALAVAAARPRDVAAVVSRGGRPDLAGDAVLRRVVAPTLLVVGGDDVEVLELNRRAQRLIAGPAQLAVVPGATHLFEEAGALDAAAAHAARWFARWLR